MADRHGKPATVDHVVVVGATAPPEADGVSVGIAVLAFLDPQLGEITDRQPYAVDIQINNVLESPESFRIDIAHAAAVGAMLIAAADRAKQLDRHQ